MRSPILALAAAAMLLPASQALAQYGMMSECRPHEYGNPDLFANYYVGPGCGSVSAEMYPAPHPVPAWVGHTYFTYQPFMPHEFLYKHHRVYHRYYNEGRGLTRTSVHWR
jgi:hypothetical protein